MTALITMTTRYLLQGKVQGLFEPFVVTEKGTINKEKCYIPKSLIERYDREILYFGITEQEANTNSY